MTAVILHRPHPIVEAIVRQLSQLGMRHRVLWPDLRDGTGDVLFYDADMGHDGQFPWAPGEAPMPSVALIGSEAPGRLAWAIRRGADAHLLKPVGSGGIYSALVIAQRAFESRRALTDEASGLRARLEGREIVAEATACLMLRDNISADEAYRLLRRLAMEARQTIDQTASGIVETLRSGHVRRDRA